MPVGEVLFTFAHHFGKYFRYLYFCGVKTESDEARREHAARATSPRVLLRQMSHNQEDA
jgi:hypothetical protein